MISVLCMLCVFGCDDEMHAPVMSFDSTPSDNAIDDVVYQNCRLVEAAAEAYAVDHEGVYPEYPTSWINPAETFINYFPDSALLTNPVTGQPTEPVWKEPSGIGSTSYKAFGLYDEEWHMKCVGYLIIGRGEEGDITITNLPDSVRHMEARVIDNCWQVRDAVEAWAAESGGFYPGNLSEKSPLGNTVFDLLPDGRLLENPYTGQRTEPMDGVSACPGQSGYMVRCSEGENTGYAITGTTWNSYTVFTYESN